MKIKKVLKKSLFYICLLLIFYMLCNVEVGYSGIKPFGISFLFSLLLFKYKVLQSSACYLIASMLSYFSVYGIYITINVLLVVIITYFIIKKTKLKLNKYLALLPLIFANICYIYFNIGGLKENFATLLSLLLMVIFYFLCLNFVNAFLNRGLIYLNLDEKICSGVFFIVLIMGINNIEIYSFDVFKLINIFILLVSNFCFSSLTTFLLASLMGVSYLLSNFDVSYISILVLFALVIVAFKGGYRIYSVIAIILMDILIGLYLKVYIKFGFIDILPTLISGTIYLLIPKRLFNLFKDIFANKKEKIAIRSLVNRTKSGICKRMNELAQVFKEMDAVFRDMVKGVLTEEEANVLLTQECVNKVCINCPDKHNCARNNNSKDVISNLVRCGLERGKATLLDVPQYLIAKCGRINFLINTLNQQVKSYKNYTQLIDNMDASRVLIADQLGGVSDILKKLGEEIRINISFDLEKENRIIEELNYKNIICFEAIVYEEGKINKSVTLLLKKGQYKNELIEKGVSLACDTKMSVVNVDESSVPDTKIVHLKNSANYDISFGSASVSKNGILKNGDAHSLIKIDNGRYILSLCDGIGSGDKAQKISNLSITLIENFYKAGFENDTILNSINKLLSLNNEENFSSVDLCVMDFHNNLLDFIKLGATYGFIKKPHSVEVIDSSGLPIGVLEEMRPHITQKIIDPFDTIILVSDGISDSFDNKSELQDYIMGISSINPQTIADEIMDRAKDLNDGIIKDDMTVLVVRIFPI